MFYTITTFTQWLNIRNKIRAKRIYSTFYYKGLDMIAGKFYFWFCFKTIQASKITSLLQGHPFIQGMGSWDTFKTKFSQDSIVGSFLGKFLSHLNPLYFVFKIVTFSPFFRRLFMGLIIISAVFFTPLAIVFSIDYRLLFILIGIIGVSFLRFLKNLVFIRNIIASTLFFISILVSEAFPTRFRAKLLAWMKSMKSKGYTTFKTIVHDRIINSLEQVVKSLFLAPAYIIK